MVSRARTIAPTAQEDIITTLILGFPIGNTNTQLQEAIALKPTVLFVWIGSNDALVADDTEMPSSMTPIASFTSDFTQLMSTPAQQKLGPAACGELAGRDRYPLPDDLRDDFVGGGGADG